MNNWKLRSGIVLVRIQGVCLLAADREARRTCPSIQEINEIGAVIWEMLEKDATYDEILLTVRDTYDIPDGYDLEADIRAFIESLKEQHYIMEGDSCL